MYLPTNIDMTTAYIVFSLLGIEKYSEDDLYCMFGTPECQTLETESGESTGPETPEYIVKPLDFRFSGVNHVSKHVRIIDFDQSFPVASPPDKLWYSHFPSPGGCSWQTNRNSKRRLGSRLFYISHASRRIPLLRIRSHISCRPDEGYCSDY